MRICIDAGHGGSDPGACGNNAQEKNLNLDYANAIKNELLKYNNVEIIMTREKDEDVGISRRAQISNESNADLYVSCHNNAYNGAAHGCEIIKSIYASAEFTVLCENIVKEIVNSLGVTYRSVYSKQGSNGDYFGVIRETKCPAMIIEALFIDNPDDYRKFDAAKLGSAIAQTIAKHYNLLKNEIPISKGVTSEHCIYRVVAGSYKLQENADKQVKYLKSLGVDSFIIEYKN